MKTTKKLVVGILILALTAAFSIPLQAAKVYALEASDAQLNSLASSVKFSSDKTKITGKIGDTTITFERKQIPGNFSNPYEFVATNLDCNGEKAKIVTVKDGAPVNVNPLQPGIYLFAKAKQGNNCSEEKQIKTGLNPNDSPTIQDAGSGSGSGSGGDSCETSGSGPLGWILCPIIDLAATFTQFVFNNFVQPFLEDVPVSTKPGDGTYEAWKSFRLIGNIVLVGTMIAVVYAQVRGDR